MLPTMIDRQSSTIVNVSLISTRSTNHILYSTSKVGVNAMTASLTFEYANEGIRVTAVATDDKEVPLRKILRNNKPSTEKD